MFKYKYKYKCKVTLEDGLKRISLNPKQSQYKEEN